MDRCANVYKGVYPDAMVCDQVLRILPDGQWLALFMTGGQTEPVLDNYVALCRSHDEGETWSKPEQVLRYPDRACVLTEVILDNTTLTAHVQIHGGGFDRWHNATIRSEDGGRTWSDPETFAALPRRGFVRNVHRASWGSWIAPFTFYPPGEDIDRAVWKDGSFQNAAVGTLTSDDRGATWRRSNTVFGSGWAEPTVTELSDGRLVMLIRRDESGCLWRSESKDRGATWSESVATDIPNPGTKARLWRLDDGRIALVHNPNPILKRRNPMSLWISSDDMQSWAYKRDFCTFPGQLSYPDGVLSADQRFIHLLFDYNRHDLIYWGLELPPR